MLSRIAKKEIIQAFRDIRLQVAAGLIFTLMLVAVLLGKNAQQQVQNERAEAQAVMYDRWVNQGNKHPHSAAHYGQFAFKPKPVLSFLDVGLDNYTGVSVFLEAHKQNEILFSGAQDNNVLTRFGEMTAAMVFQLLIPLLIIFLAFNTFTKERTEGTLKMLAAQGVSMRQLFASKVTGIYLITMVLFLPVVFLSYLFLNQSSGSETGQIGLRFLGIIGVYALYFLIFTFLAVGISAWSKNAGLALLTLLGIWIVAGVIMPKASTNLASKLYPAPSQFEFRKTIKTKVKSGIDGHNPSDVRLASLKKSTLKEYGVASIEELPVNWSGIAMQAGEEYTDQVYDQEFSKVEQVFQRQNRLSEWLGFFNPYLAIRNLSMGLSGTDFHHHIAFAKAAEDYRRYFVKEMNKDMEVNHKPGVAYADYKIGKEMWSSISPFSYQQPSFNEVLQHHWRSWSALLLWIGGLLALVFTFSKRISILPV
ncbi:MAG: DUF3526 domain-containing protein [Bacteroidota bacterium]